MNTTTQLSFEDAILARDVGMDRADIGAADAWRTAAAMAILQCAKDSATFIIDDVWQYMPEGVGTGDKRAMGPCIMRAAKAGLITKTGEYRLSEQVNCHRNPRTVWRSRE